MKSHYARVFGMLGGGLALWLALALPTPAQAERADRQQPTQVEADAMRYDDLKQINEFRGRVVLTQGTLSLRADRLTLRQDPEGYQFGDAQGRPAQFRQKRDGTNEWIEGQADTLHYDGRTESVTLKGRAQVRRLIGTQVQDEIEGSQIVYDSRTEQFQVEGPSASTPEGTPKGRVRVTIQPRVDSAAAPPVATPPRLRPAPALP